MNTLRLALRMLGRDWHAGELRVLIAALVLAVASVGTVGFFTDRVKGALTRQANLLLGGDLLLSGDRPLPDDYVRRGASARPRRRPGDQVQQHGAGRDWRSRHRCRAGRRQGGRRRVIRCEARSRLPIRRCPRDHRHWNSAAGQAPGSTAAWRRGSTSAKVESSLSATRR